MTMYGYVVLDDADLQKAIEPDFRFRKLKFENRRVYKTLSEAWIKTSPKLTTALKLEFTVTQQEIEEAIRNCVFGVYDPHEYSTIVLEVFER